jgi:beta-glucanase (GH16 family)
MPDHFKNVFIMRVILFVCCALPFMQFMQSPRAASKLVWSDEFNYKGLPDSARWGYDTGGHGWGNNELQFYTAGRLENARVENGHLIIQARKENYHDKQYTSARLITKNKGDWKYGRMEIRARLPKGKGMWPAIWMLPTDWEYGDWPKSGEIDIMEHVGYMPDSIFGTVHTGAFNHTLGTQKGRSIFCKDVYDAFHIYSIEWREDRIDFFIDNKQYYSFSNNKSGAAAWPFDKRFHLLLNIAVGGNWGGKYGVDDAIFPQSMEVDYVRVYQ